MHFASAPDALAGEREHVAVRREREQRVAADAPGRPRAGVAGCRDWRVREPADEIAEPARLI
jgi:hypothetical protein